MSLSFIDKSLSLYSIIHIDIISAWCQPLSMGFPGGCTTLSQFWKSLSENIFMPSQPTTQIKCRAAQKNPTDRPIFVNPSTNFTEVFCSQHSWRASTDLHKHGSCLFGLWALWGNDFLFRCRYPLHSTSPAVIKLIIIVTMAIIIIEIIIIIISSRMMRRRAEGQQVCSGNNIIHQILRSERMSVWYQRHYLWN